MGNSLVLDSTAALADPTRRAIIARLATGEATVGELAQPFEMSLPAVSKHVSVLEEAGLVRKRHEGRKVLGRDGSPRWSRVSTWRSSPGEGWCSPGSGTGGAQLAPPLLSFDGTRASEHDEALS